MNCKPGDIAYIIHPSRYGALVSVIEAAPVGDFYLPDGYFAFEASKGSWVCESLGSPFDAPVYNTRTGKKSFRKARFAAIHDRWLRPIRDADDDVPCDSAAWLPPVPQHDEVTA